MDELLGQLHSYLKGIWKYRWYAMATAWFVVLVGGVAVYLVPNRYEASARVFVDTQGILKPLLSSMTTVPNVQQQVSIMSRTLISRPNVERIMRMVDMDLNADTVQVVDALMKEIRIAGTGRDDIYSISYSHADPKLAKNVVQSLLTVFVESSLGDKKQDSSKAILFLDEQIKSYEEKLVAAENALKDFKQKNGELLPRQGSGHETKLAEVLEELSAAKLELAEAEQARDAIKRQIAGEDPALMADQDPSALANPELDSRLQTLKKNLDSLELQFTPQHPDIISTKRLIARLEERKVEEAKSKKRSGDPGMHYSPMLQQLKIALSDAEARLGSMRARVAEYSARAARLRAMTDARPELERQLSQLNRDYSVNKENYEKLVGRREAAKLSGDLSSTTDLIKFRVIDPPIVPHTPVAPNRPRLFSAVFAAALLAGAAVAFLFSQLRPTFLNRRSLSETTQLPVLGSVTMNWTDQERLRRKKSMYLFAASFAFLIAVFSAGMVSMLLKLEINQFLNHSIARLR